MTMQEIDGGMRRGVLLQKVDDTPVVEAVDVSMLRARNPDQLTGGANRFCQSGGMLSERHDRIGIDVED